MNVPCMNCENGRQPFKSCFATCDRYIEFQNIKSQLVVEGVYKNYKCEKIETTPRKRSIGSMVRWSY